MVTYPSDWDERSLGDFVHVGRGASPRPIEAYLTSSVDGVNWIKIGDAPRYGKYITQTAEKITQSGAARSVRVNAGDFILSNSMSFGRPYILSIDGCIHDGWLRLYDYQDSVDKEFLYYLLSTEDTKKQYATFAAGSGVQNLNKTVVKKVVVHLPSIPEQRRIARVLSEMDDHIDNLAELIEKKKAIRDGALEDLVSGKTRLAGFTEPWREMRLDQFTDINPKTTIPDTFMYVDLESVVGIDLISPRRVKASTAPSRARRYASKGDVFYQTVRPYQKNNYLFDMDGDYVFSTGYAQLRTDNDYHYLFLLIRLDSFVNKVLDNCTGTSYPAINPTRLGGIPVFVPVDKKEQKAIADVLTAMDEENKDLEDERNKMIQIREGAMDDLLTGRVRLMV